MTCQSAPLAAASEDKARRTTASGTPITPESGHHAAANLTNESLHSLVQAALLELAVRTDRDTYESVLRSALDDRAGAEELIFHIRHQRDLMRFAADVRRDIDALPTTLTSR